MKQLDGSRDIARLTDALMAAVKAGALVLHRDDDKTPVTEEKEMRKLLGPALEKVLINLARKALLTRTDTKPRAPASASRTRSESRPAS